MPALLTRTDDQGPEQPRWTSIAPSSGASFRIFTSWAMMSRFMAPKLHELQQVRQARRSGAPGPAAARCTSSSIRTRRREEVHARLDRTTAPAGNGSGLVLESRGARAPRVRARAQRVTERLAEPACAIGSRASASASRPLMPDERRPGLAAAPRGPIRTTTRWRPCARAPTPPCA